LDVVKKLEYNFQSQTLIKEKQLKNFTAVRPPSHYCGLLLARVSGACNSVEFLVVDHHRAGRRSMKFPGGMSMGEEIPFVDMVKTIRREAREEIGDLELPEKRQLAINLSDDLLAKRVIMQIEASSPDGSKHRKFFYLLTIEEISGFIRSKGVDDGDEWLSPPRWVTAEELYNGVFGSHFPPFVMGLKLICDVFEPAKDRYSYVFQNTRVKEIIAVQEKK
jgi:8-oxo-dGTP pyrophosphatase MutT (NUDIX family)